MIRAPANAEAPRFAVQVGAFRDRANAERVERDMKRKYGTARLVRRGGDPRMWRVLVGEESTPDGAEALAARIRAEGEKKVPASSSGWIRELNNDPQGLVGESPQIVADPQDHPETRPLARGGPAFWARAARARKWWRAPSTTPIPRGAFVPIDCGSLPDQLMESELFGHAKGAFTGAGDAKKGLVEMADGGTAFFDEIGDLRARNAGQAAARSCRSARSGRWAGWRARRWTSASSPPPTAISRAKSRAARFREDLFYRLNVIKLRLPPLRERKQDIPHAGGLLPAPPRGEPQRQPAGHGPHAGLRLARQRARAAERHRAHDRAQFRPACSTCRTSPPRCSIMRGFAQPVPVFEDVEDEAGLPEFRQPISKTPVSVPEAEKRAIADALAFTKGDRVRAAQLLGIGRTTLYRKLKQYKIGT